jgi:hypothetical protein
MAISGPSLQHFRAMKKMMAAAIEIYGSNPDKK